jgi:hypothetical protein
MPGPSVSSLCQENCGLDTSSNGIDASSKPRYLEGWHDRHDRTYGVLGCRGVAPPGCGVSPPPKYAWGGDTPKLPSGGLCLLNLRTKVRNSCTHAFIVSVLG